MRNPDYKQMADGAKETIAQREAFTFWVNLGKGRTLVAVRKRFGMSSATIKKWHHSFHWEDRLSNMREQGQEVTLFQKPEPVTDTQDMLELRALIERLKLMVDSAFEVDDETGEEKPKFEINSISGFTKIVKEYRDCVEAYARLQAPQRGKKGEPEKNRIADTVNIIMGMSQEERLELITGSTNKNILVPGGHGAPESPSEDADYTEIPDGGLQDRRGCVGVPGGVEGAKGGDKGKLRKGGSHITFPSIK